MLFFHFQAGTSLSEGYSNWISFVGIFDYFFAAATRGSSQQYHRLCFQMFQKKTRNVGSLDQPILRGIIKVRPFLPIHVGKFGVNATAIDK